MTEKRETFHTDENGNTTRKTTTSNDDGSSKTVVSNCNLGIFGEVSTAKVESVTKTDKNGNSVTKRGWW